MAGVRIPVRSQVAPLQHPLTGFHSYLQWIVGRRFRGLTQVNVEFEVGIRRSTDETRVSILDHPMKRRILRAEGNRLSADLDGYGFWRDRGESGRHGSGVRDGGTSENPGPALKTPRISRLTPLRSSCMRIA